MDFELYLKFQEWEQIFEVVSYRGRVGFDNSIEYIIHTNEQGHNTAHLHAKYQDKEIVIGIISGKVIAGNMESQKTKQACEWVLNNQQLLKSRWNELSNGIKIDVL